MNGLVLVYILQYDAMCRPRTLQGISHDEDMGILGACSNEVFFFNPGFWFVKKVFVRRMSLSPGDLTRCSFPNVFQKLSLKVLFIYYNCISNVLCPLHPLA